MKLEDFDEVTKLRNHRRGVENLRRKAESQPLHMRFGYSEQDQVEVASWLDVMPIREAVIRECDMFLMENKDRLQELGVTVEDPKS